MSFSAEIATATKTCFIVSPMDLVSRRKIESCAIPACTALGYRPEFADDQTSQNIRDGIVTSLSVAPMVIAYLGRRNPDWNNNVILELGYRMATLKPMVILCDDVNDLQLPFHIRTDRVIRIPASDEIAPALLESLVKDITDQMVDADRTRTDMLSNQAIALIHAPRAGVEGRETYYVAASKRASEVLGYKGRLVGLTLSQFIEARRDDMPPFQFEAFQDEQASIASAASPGGPVVVAKVPMVFSKGKMRGRAFLPIIVNYHQVGEIQEFRVLYLDVTDNCEWIYDEFNDRYCYYAHMNPRCAPLNLPDETYSVFLAYNTADRAYVRAIYERMCTHQIKPWFDEEDLEDGAEIFSVISTALETCRTALLFIGKNEFGRFQQAIELPTMLGLLNDKKLKVVSVLMDGLKEPPNPILKTHKWVTSEEVTDDWIRSLRAKPKPR